jgi:hypothetical protein
MLVVCRNYFWLTAWNKKYIFHVCVYAIRLICVSEFPQFFIIFCNLYQMPTKCCEKVASALDQSAIITDPASESADLITLFINHMPDYDEYTGKLLGIKKKTRRIRPACEEWTSVRTFKPAISNDL